jgi:hypothetical protein
MAKLKSRDQPRNARPKLRLAAGIFAGLTCALILFMGVAAAASRLLGRVIIAWDDWEGVAVAVVLFAVLVATPVWITVRKMRGGIWHAAFGADLGIMALFAVAYLILRATTPMVAAGVIIGMPIAVAISTGLATALAWFIAYPPSALANEKLRAATDAF